MEEIRGDDILKRIHYMQEQCFFMMKETARSGLTTSSLQVAFLHLDVVDRQDHRVKSNSVRESTGSWTRTSLAKARSMCIARRAGRGAPPWWLPILWRWVTSPICHLLCKAILQVEGLSIEEAVEVVRQARPHIKLYKPHYEALETFHSTKIAKSTS